MELPAERHAGIGRVHRIQVARAEAADSLVVAADVGLRPDPGLPDHRPEREPPAALPEVVRDGVTDHHDARWRRVGPGVEVADGSQRDRQEQNSDRRGGQSTTNHGSGSRGGGDAAREPHDGVGVGSIALSLGLAVIGAAVRHHDDGRG